MSEETFDYNRLICAIVESVGGEVFVSSSSYLDVKPVEIIEADGGYIFKSTADTDE